MLDFVVAGLSANSVPYLEGLEFHPPAPAGGPVGATEEAQSMTGTDRSIPAELQHLAESTAPVNQAV